MSTPSLWGDKHPAIKGLRPPERHAGHFHADQQILARVNKREQLPNCSPLPAAPRQVVDGRFEIKHKIGSGSYSGGPIELEL